MVGWGGGAKMLKLYVNTIMRAVLIPWGDDNIGKLKLALINLLVYLVT